MIKIQHIILSLIITLLVLNLQTSSALADKRVALIIGNSTYSHAAALANPSNDASDISATLKRLNFEVITGLDLDKTAMDGVIRKFAKALETADVALFYYAGHGLQVNGQNYLVPTNAKLSTITDLDFDTVPLSLVIRQMERKQRTNIVFLDACRDNPLMTNLARSMGSSRSTNLTRGLARVETGVGTLISYSTQPGNVALDGTGRNSPFTKALLKHIATPGADISDIMISVRKDVLTASDGKQVPWENSSLTGQFYFTPKASPPKTPIATKTRASENKVTVNTVDDNVLDLAFWNAIKNSKNPGDMEAYLQKFPNGIFAALARRKVETSRAITVEPKSRPAPEPQSQKLAKLDQPDTPPETKPKPVETTPPLDETALVISLQTHLKRVGCYAGGLDGDWGNMSRTALRRFNSETKRRLPVGEATQQALDAVKKHKGRICHRPVVVRERIRVHRDNDDFDDRNAPPSRSKPRCRTVNKPDSGVSNESPWERVCD